MLLILTLLTGLALGWALNDLLRAEGAADRQLTATVLTNTPQPTAEAIRPSAVPATATRPTAVLSEAATAVVTSSPPPPTPVPQPPSPAIEGYAGHIVAEGETLEQIAANGGSTPELIAAYNLLGGPPRPGRALIVPRLAGAVSALDNEPIMVQRGATDRPWVALTLDAGAGAEPTPRMLQALRARGVRITFFLTGRWIAENPDLTRQIVADGHELANHTYGHPDLTTADDEVIRRELADAEAALAEVAPDATLRPFFRPPFGAYDERVQRVVQAEGYLPVYWTLDSLDSVGEPKTPAFLLERVTGRLTPEELRGAIILAHCGSAPTAAALPAILDRFAAMGFEVRKLSEVLG
ncbi:MAG TPA: polysaccharide deacetylase family protein [Roseiflexaceae bacterium]|nr:polysaccharide deacetylase family protein [Roseiflexaceae bacterium]